MGKLVVSNVSKAYKRYPGKWARVLEWLTGKPHHEKNWVLRDINFTVSPGESVGIIGVNGAGKSTLLKIITGTTQATTGTVFSQGRVAALLELGMGFHPDFTGRQNALMAGQLQGYTLDQITELMSEIERFAEIGDYIDHPVRTYSSGMQVRLAFAVATATRPDILIVDEALAVGDIFFQQKCFDRIRFFRELGTTLLFVSHSPGTVYALCDRAILLSGGKLLLDDKPKVVIDYYDVMVTTVKPKREVMHRSTNVYEADLDVPLLQIGGEEIQPIWRHPGVRVRSVSILKDDCPVNLFVCSHRANLRIDIVFTQEFDDPHVGFRVHNGRGETVFMTNTLCMKKKIGAVHPENRIIVNFDFHVNIAPGEYTLTVGVANGAIGGSNFREQLARLMHIRSFTVAEDPVGIVWSGYSYLSPSLVIQRDNSFFL